MPAKYRNIYSGDGRVDSGKSTYRESMPPETTKGKANKRASRANIGVHMVYLRSADLD